jgi:hypothetical protein
MTEFELLAIPVSLVLGLGITKMLSAVATLIRNRRQVRFHWLPVAWATWIFLVCVQFFFYMWDLYEMNVPFTWSVFGPLLWHCVLLFLAAGLVLPGPGLRQEPDSLLEDFQNHGRLALIPFAIVTLDAILNNVLQYGDTWFSEANILNLVFIMLVLIAFFTRKLMQQTATIALGAVLIYGLMYVWSRPGVAPWA